MTEQEIRAIPYNDALVATAMLQLELVGQANNLDPNNSNEELMARTALAVNATEALVAMLFERSAEQVHEDIAQLDPAIIQKAIQNLAIAHVSR